MEEDKRFSHIANDPKFRRIPKTERKVKIDKRFKSMFKDKQFKVKYTTDKRGRPVDHTSNEDLKRYYELGSDESSAESDIESSVQVQSTPSGNESDQSTSNQLQIKQKNDKQIPDKVKIKLKNLNIDYARGESTLLSESSSDDEESATEDSEDDSFEHAWGELDRDAEKCEEVTHRVAACNMDWDRIRAVDLMVLLSSFLPPGGLIKSVRIYPSEFGLQRMKEEEIKGPTELVETKPTDDNEGHEGSKYHMEKLRQYQLNRLKYYYAVIDCDNENTASKIYNECDGMEYESSATKMDLRFIPDDMDFDQAPKETCEKLPEQGKYLPRFFTTTALQQAKVDLTWDETNPDRIEITQKLASGNVDDIADGDLQAYLASSSGEEDADEQEKVDDEDSDKESNINSIDKYKALLQDIESNEKAKHNKDVEMEITWGIDLKGKTEKLVKKKLDEKEEKTPFQQYLDKRKEKQKAKREERKKKRENEENTNSDSDSDIPSDIDMNDPYFAEEFNKPEFKQKKNKKPNQNIQEPDKEDLQKKAELELLLLDADDDKKHFSLQKIQARENENKSKKKKKGEVVDQDQEDNFTVNVGDERFSALYSSHHFNLDPTDPHYKKTKGMEAIVTEKLKRRSEGNTESKRLKTDSSKKDAELSVLVKSIKRKTEALSNKKRK